VKALIADGHEIYEIDVGPERVDPGACAALGRIHHGYFLETLS
jgi:hypothetical protein